MTNRFASKRARGATLLRDVIFSVSLFVCVLLLFMWGVSSITESTEEEKLLALQSAVQKATVQCYAVEGQYPASIDYLEEHYGLQVDHEKYIVHYEGFAGNIMPQINVLPRYF